MYTKKKLQEMTEEIGQKVLTKTATTEEALLGMAASHTIDFLGIAEDSNIQLSISEQTEENIPKVMILLHRHNLERNLTVEESRKDLVKKVGGYELFSLLNGFEASGVKVETKVVLNRLILEHQNPDGKIIRFDVLREMEKTLDGFRLSPEKDSFILMGTLQPFYQTLVKDFLKQIQ